LLGSLSLVLLLREAKLGDPITAEKVCLELEEHEKGTEKKVLTQSTQNK